MTTYLLTGGGTAGHVNPLLSLADAIRAHDASATVIALVPARGYRLETIARLPFPRRLNAYAIGFVPKFITAVGQIRKLIRANNVEVVVGFGGYASAPAYLAAKFEKIPLVIHEANALPGIANRIGAKFADVVAVAFEGTPLPKQQFAGMPLRAEIEAIVKNADKPAARKHFGLDESNFTLLVTGGSLGAKKLNDVIEGSRNLLSAAGIQVLHIIGGKSDLEEVHTSSYCRIKYCDRMDLAIAAADFAVSRAGASTVSEFTAVGLPAVYVPYAVGNGEQTHNLATLLKAEAGLVVADKDFSADYVAQQLIPLVSNASRVKQMAQAAKSVGVSDGTARLLKLVLGVLPKRG